MPSCMPRDGQISRLQCRNCFKRAEFECKGVKLQTEETRKNMKKKKKTKKHTDVATVPSVPLPGLQIGTPLPNKGACKHFKKSYRYFRFPCCGRAFACPVCHELSGCEFANGTYSVRATHEICGKCSSEQKIEGDSQVCSACKFNMGKRRGRTAHFWSGGTRDNTLLSKKDCRKKKGGGSSLKTTSKKSLRVGLKGKKEREKKLAGGRVNNKK